MCIILDPHRYFSTASKMRSSHLSASLFAFSRDLFFVCNELILRMYLVVTEQVFPNMATATILAQV
jgi:hypothetical protein